MEEFVEGNRTRESGMTASSSTATIIRRSISGPGLMRKRTAAADSPRMLQGIATRSWRITTSNNTGLPSHAVYAGEESFILSAIILVIFDSGLSPGPISAEVRAAYSPADKENPSKLNTRFLSE
jgi:hypothetical protein